MQLSWQWQLFNEFDNTTLYQLLRFRAQIFSIEPRRLFLDVDNKDSNALHLLGWHEKEIIAYARLFLPTPEQPIIQFNRVAVAKKYRCHGVGKHIINNIMKYIMANSLQQYPVEISAQHYLQKFYKSWGFERISEPYMQDGILRIDMRHNSFAEKIHELLVVKD